MKKSLTVGIISLFILSALAPMSLGYDITGITENRIFHGLDQYQTTCNGSIGGLSRMAQSFKPTMKNLTKVDLIIDYLGNPSGELLITIRSSLNGSDLTSASIPAENVTGMDNWYEFDFPDINLTPGQTYYIVWNPDKENWDGDNLCLWGCDHFDDLYPRGELWHENSTGFWYVSHPKTDCCFKTWGFVINTPPNIPDIKGPPIGDPGNTYGFCITASDPDGDNLYVRWDWDDGTGSEWSGPFESGMEVCDSHVWYGRGTYFIKVTVRDEHGASVTASLKIVIPRTRAWLRFLDMFPILQRILQRLG